MPTRAELEKKLREHGAGEHEMYHQRGGLLKKEVLKESLKNVEARKAKKYNMTIHGEGKPHGS